MQQVDAFLCETKEYPSKQNEHFRSNIINFIKKLQRCRPMSIFTRNLLLAPTEGISKIFKLKNIFI